MKKRFFPAKLVTSFNRLRDRRQGLSWQATRGLLIGGMGLLTSLVVVCSGVGFAQQAPATNEAPITTTPAPVIPSPEATVPARSTAATPDAGGGTRGNASVRATTGPLSQYLLEFSRSPDMGSRFRMEGVYGESRFGFTRPRDWAVKGAKAIIHFQHSPSLVPARSNLVVRVNDTSIGVVPLDLKSGQIGEAVVVIPPNLIQDYNEIVLVAQQENSPTCSNAQDKSLWTEVLPDSKLVFDYQPQALPLDFSRYPHPFFDELALEPTRLNYLQPATIDANWLTAASRFQAQMGQVADFRPIATQLVKEAKGFRWNDRLVILGTPEQQPMLKTLKLPLALNGNQFVDRDKSAIANDEGLLMLTSLQEGTVPVLVITGNTTEAVKKAAQFLVQPKNAQTGTSALIQVKGDVQDVAAPNRRDWPRFLPEQSKFTLKDMKGSDGKPYKAVMVRGSSAPPVEFNFWALPDDRFVRGSSMTLHYSYSAQADPRNSTVSVAIDGINIGSKKLSDRGGTDESFTVDLPENLIKPNSKIRVDFKLEPQANTERNCGRLTDQHLWGTVLDNTSFAVNREIGANLPDLKLLTYGYPLSELQDLSRMAIVLPDAPKPADVMTMLKFSERMGRLSRANSISHNVYLGANAVDDGIKKNRHLVEIGARDRLPFAQVFEGKKGFNLTDAVGRQLGNSTIQTLPNADGMIKSVISPWNSERIIVALTGQTEQGLKQVQDVLGSDAWFYQLQGDTAAIAANSTDPNPYDPNGYRLQFSQESSPQTLENLNPLNKVRRFLQNHFYLLPIGIIAVSLLMYGVAQRYLKRVSEGN
jgi:cellulose synthase operon protein B